MLILDIAKEMRIDILHLEISSADLVKKKGESAVVVG